MKENYVKLILLALIAVVGVQGYYLYDMKRETGEDSLLAKSLTSHDFPPPVSLSSNDVDPFIEMERLRREIENSFINFDNFFQTTPSLHQFSSRFYRTPRFDMKEQDGKYIITMEIPGFEKSAIEVKAKDGELSVIAKGSAVKDDNTTKYYRNERRASSYMRTISLPTDANEDSFRTEYKDGLLTIFFDKKIP